jgi:hypothetical protein
MANVIESAPNARSKCRGCGERIAAGVDRFGERLPNPFGEGEAEMTHWFHLPCAVFRRPEAVATMDLTGHEPFRAEVDLGVAHPKLTRISAAERAASGRAACRACREPIPKDAWRISLVYYDEARFVPSGFIHLACARTYFEVTNAEPILARVKFFSPALTAGDEEELKAGIGPTTGIGHPASGIGGSHQE